MQARSSNFGMDHSNPAVMINSPSNRMTVTPKSIEGVFQWHQAWKDQKNQDPKRGNVRGEPFE